MKPYLLFLLVIPFCSNCVFATKGITMQSPKQKITATIAIIKGQLNYAVKAEGQTIIATSLLGLTIDQQNYGSAVATIKLIKKHLVKENYAVSGKHALAVNNYQSYLFQVNLKDKNYYIEFRLFDDGIAFRYILNNTTQVWVNNEQTSFTLPVKCRVWYFERNNDWKLKSYAGLWQSTPIDSLPIVSSQGPIQGKPLIVTLANNKYLALTEAALYDYSGLRFNAIGNRALQVNFTEGENGFSVNKNLQTPWRVVIYAKDLNALVNTDLISNLNPKPDQKLYAQTAYIKPGRAVWSWLTQHAAANYMQPAAERSFIDAAQKLGFEYTMIDEGWETNWKDKWLQLKQLCTYAKSKNVSVWVWKHSKELLQKKECDQFLDSIKNAGVVGIKTDFMNSEAKSLIDFELYFLKACAARKLMVNFHGCQSPSGESRTYPNELTREGVRGMELNILNEPIPAWHNAALPFTRYIAGHGDYTPGLFSNKGNTTNVQQLAMFYLLESSFQCLADDPKCLLNNQKYKPIVAMLKQLPVTWDETIVLPGSDIGKIAAMARRKGNTWYVAVINGTNKAVTFPMLASFLNPKANYSATIVADDNEGGVGTQNKTIKYRDQLNYKLLPNGGVVLTIKVKNR